MLELAIQAALAAGQEIMRIYTDPSLDFSVERKADNSPLTIADKAAHERIKGFLDSTGIPVLSEEGVHQSYVERKTWSRMWVVDPLDGTKEFIKKNGEFTVNIALVEHGVPVLGVVYIPEQKILYYASQSAGAWRVVDDGKPQPLPINENHDGFVIVASRSHMSPETEDFVHKIQKEHTDVRLVSSGSSIKICLVAEGIADIYPRFAPTMEWDTAAGDAIARIAGKAVVDATTQCPLLYNKEDLHNPWFIVR